jgi:hypothetical protein
MILWGCITKKAKKAAEAFPQCGHVPTPQNAVDIPSDDASLNSTFYGMGRAEMMPSELEPFLSRQEFGEAFININNMIRATTGFRYWHLIFYPACLLFWPLGGFMLMVWGVERTKSQHITAIGTYMEPLCRAKGLSYVVMASTQAGKHGGQSRPAIVRIFLTGMAGGNAMENTLVGMPYGNGP